MCVCRWEPSSGKLSDVWMPEAREIFLRERAHWVLTSSGVKEMLRIIALA